MNYIFSLTLANKHYCTKNIYIYIYIYIIIVLVLKRYIIHEKVGINILSRNKETIKNTFTLEIKLDVVE